MLETKQFDEIVSTTEMKDVKETKILQDVSKTTFALPQVLLQMINMWPLQQNVFTKFAFFIKLTLIVLLEVGQLIYVAFNLTDITKLASIMSTLSTTLQGIVKLTVIYVHMDTLKDVIHVAFNEFWPSNCMGTKLERSLKWAATIVIISMYSIVISAIIFAFGFLTKPLIEGVRVLPFESWYPFNWTLSPIYECVYILQTFVNIFIVIVSILGHDFFYLALTLNIIAQYRLLQAVMEKLGEPNLKLNEIFENFNGVHIKPLKDVTELKKLLIAIVEHHNKLLDVSTKMQAIYSFSLFIQLAASVTAICMSSFLLTVTEIDRTQLYHLTSYCLGHVMQLFIICAAGNELTHHSVTLGDFAFGSKWYLDDFKDLRKSLILLIKRSQRGSQITAVGIFHLNYNTFVTVMRLSFSFYTLLSTIIEKKST